MKQKIVTAASNCNDSPTFAEHFVRANFEKIHKTNSLKAAVFKLFFHKMLGKCVAGALFFQPVKV